MPKNLFLCRHAEAQEALENQLDFDRELTPTGMQEATKAGSFIKSFGLTIDEIICSAALRTRQTAATIAEVLNYEPSKLKPRQELYYPSAATILNAIASLPKSAQTVIIVNHNPAVSQVVSKLTNSKVYVPTGGCNYFISEAIEWALVEHVPFKLHLNY
ncbi:MAG: SixA phosphatase family protein [Adhaeribacter sp.]